MQICVRLPNWLGDTIMSLGFVQFLKDSYPGAKISLITKKGLEGIVSVIPGIEEVIVFSKENYKGLRGVWAFGKMLSAKQKFDLFFILPDSFSSALMAFASGAKQRVGFRKEGRNFLLTHAFNKPKGMHRVEEYASLMQMFQPQISFPKPEVNLPVHSSTEAVPYIVINANSESITSRIPISKAVQLIHLFQSYHLPIKLIGSKKEEAYVSEIYNAVTNKINIEVLVGKTTLFQLTELLHNAKLVVSSDSGPAHIASAVGVPLVVVTGAGDENNTGPYNNKKAIAVRNGTLPCEPCVKNKCKLATLPVCLVELNMRKVKAAAEEIVSL